MNSRLLCVALLACCATGCASPPTPLPPAADPASAESAMPVLPPTLAVDDAAPGVKPPQPPPLDGGPGVPAGPMPVPPATQGASYTCPMHPDVVADQPGHCPKCGMTLVRREGK